MLEMGHSESWVEGVPAAAAGGGSAGGGRIWGARLELERDERQWKLINGLLDVFL
jgi:hypothetical protein